ncbi:MAG: DUF1801 domain-containing protein [Gammaproteobacteria bacterium]|nr:DUF1801 domain-containing protein [Gammaproteobacteria bacterium]
MLTIAQYLNALTPERRHALNTIREVIAAHIDPAFEEGMQYGLPSFYLPHSIYPDGYHVDPSQPVPFASIGWQKHHIGLYLFCVYADDTAKQWFINAWRATGKRLDMGKACVRVKDLDGVPLAVIADVFKRISAEAFMRSYEQARSTLEKRTPRKKSSRQHC